MKALLIDNFDSFSYNLADEFRKRGVELLVYRNTVSVAELEALERRFPFSLVILSPGPASPKEAGNLVPIIRRFAADKVLFGVCLGHQAIAEAFGGVVSRVKPVHGKPSPIEFGDSPLFEGLVPPLRVARYHSLAATKLPSCLRATARTLDGAGVNMACEHERLPVYGVQFHPESILPPLGGRVLDNLLRIAEARGK